MKPLVICFALILATLPAFPQINVDSLMENLPDVEDNIYLSVVLPNEEKYAASTAQLIESYISQAITNTGIQDATDCSRFFVAMDYAIVKKNIIPGIPTRISSTIKFSFIIGDLVENKVFSSIACEVSGIGINEEKAMISAIQKVKWNSNKFHDFIKKGKEEIVQYYTKRGPQILEEAQMQQDQGNYEEAIGMLISVPRACPLFDECMRQSIIVYQNMVDSRALRLLNKAKAEWAVSPDKAGAEEAKAFIDSIPDDSKYQAEVEKLRNTINKRVADIEDREYQFALEKHRDSVQHVRIQQAMRTNRIIAAKKKVAKDTGYSTGSFSNTGIDSIGSGIKNFCSNLADKWNEQPTWKKIAIAGGVGLAAATVGTGVVATKVASALLSRTLIHVIL